MRRVPILEAQYRRLGERAIMDRERRARLRQCLQWRMRLAGVGVVQHRMAMHERAALGILPGDSNRDAVGQDRGERQRLGVAPVDRVLLIQGRAAAFEDALEAAVDGKAGWAVE